MNFEDFKNYAKDEKSLCKKAKELKCNEVLKKLIGEHPEYKDELGVVHSCLLSFLIIHSHLHDLANDAIQLKKNHEKLQNDYNALYSNFVEVSKTITTIKRITHE